MTLLHFLLVLLYYRNTTNLKFNFLKEYNFCPAKNFKQYNKKIIRIRIFTFYDYIVQSVYDLYRALILY